MTFSKYTDGSKPNSCVECSAVCEIPDDASVFSAEAEPYCWHVPLSNVMRSIIFLDSLSVLQAVKHR